MVAFNSNSLFTRTKTAAVEALSQVTYPNNQVDNAMASLYTTEVHMCQTLAHLQLLLQIEAKTAVIIWEVACVREGLQSQRATFGSMHCAMPQIAHIMHEVTKESAEAALQDHLASLSSSGGAAAAAHSRKTPCSTTTNNDNKTTKLKAELKILKNKNLSNEKRLQSAKYQLRENNIVYKPPPELQPADKTDKPKTTKTTQKPATDSNSGHAV